MAHPHTIAIGNVEYVRADGVDRRPTSRKILVIEGRWNIVADVERDEDTGDWLLTNAAVIIYWGTTKGLGELAVDGPTDKTRLGPLPASRVPADKVLLVIDVVSDL